MQIGKDYFYVLKGTITIVILLLVLAMVDTKVYMPVEPHNFYYFHLLVAAIGSITAWYHKDVRMSVIGLLLVVFSIVQMSNVFLSFETILTAWIITFMTVMSMMTLSILKPRYFQNSFVSTCLSITITGIMYVLLVHIGDFVPGGVSIKVLFALNGVIGYQWGESRYLEKTLDSVVDSVTFCFIKVMPDKKEKG